jgi:hypothetical protein
MGSSADAFWNSERGQEMLRQQEVREKELRKRELKKLLEELRALD